MEKSNNFLQKNCNCFITFAQMSQNESTKNVGASKEHLCTCFYVDPAISSMLQA